MFLLILKFDFKEFLSTNLFFLQEVFLRIIWAFEIIKFVQPATNSAKRLNVESLLPEILTYNKLNNNNCHFWNKLS